MYDVLLLIFFVIGIYALADNLDCLILVADFLYRCHLMFEHFIDLEEMHHLLEYVLGQFVNVVIVLVVRVVQRNGNYLFVKLAAVHHLYYAYGHAGDERHGIDALVAEDQNVQRIAVVGKRTGNKPVICGIYGRGIEYPVHPEKSRLLVEFVLEFAALGNLDKGFKFVFLDSLFANIVPDIHFTFTP